MSITGERDGRPVKPDPTIGDTGTGMLMAFSIVSALFDRVRTGKQASAEALRPFFAELAQAGQDGSDMACLRAIGLRAEAATMAATG
jgi:hypothetical protein